MRNFRLDDESGHQEALFSWAAYRTGLMPELQYMYHVPNGGKRDKATAAVLKRQGVKAGVPDIMLPTWVIPILQIHFRKAADHERIS